MKRTAIGFALLTLGGVAANATQASYLPHYDHVVVVIMANHSPADIIGNASAPYINGALLPSGAYLSASKAVFTPDQPDYIALFSGDNHGITDDACHDIAVGDNLAAQLVAANLSFAQYSEDLPAVGDTSCTSGKYLRAHNPVVDFTSLPAAMNQPYSSFAAVLAADTLPTVSFVVPNVCHDMHGETFGLDCPAIVSDLVALGDTWLSQNVPAFLASTPGQNALLVITWDQGSGLSPSLDIPTFFIGPHVKAGYQSAVPANHYSMLRTIEDMYALPALAGAATASAITDVFDDTIFSNGFEP